MKYIDAEKLIAEIERRKIILDKYEDSFETAACCKQELVWMKDFIDSLPGEIPPYITGFKGDPDPPGISDLEQAAENIYKVPFGTRAEDFIAGAEWQKEQDKDWLNEELMKAHLNGVITGDRIARESLPMPEDTVIFQKGVAEGRRLEREDNNKALAEMYGYEGGTESPLVKITFTIPKEQVKNLMPIKQGDVFGIENLTNKEGRR